MTNRWLDSTVDTYLKEFGTAYEPIVYEVGSRDGHDGVELANRIISNPRPKYVWVHPNIVLFECNPPQQEVVKTNYPEATLITEAISDKKGTVPFLQIDGDKDYVGSSSMDLDRVKYPWVKKTHTIEVPTRRLDSVVIELNHQDREIDVMKIDIEGYTYEALVSLGEYLRNVRVFHLETEIEGHARDKTNLDIALFMQERGYICTTLEHEWGDNIQDQVWCRR